MSQWRNFVKRPKKRRPKRERRPNKINVPRERRSNRETFQGKDVLIKIDVSRERRSKGDQRPKNETSQWKKRRLKRDKRLNGETFQEGERCGKILRRPER